MKSRRKTSQSNKPVIKRSDSYIERNQKSTSTPQTTNRRSSSTTSLQRNIEFWQKHCRTFEPINSFNNYGDADTFFRKSLRNYNKFDTGPIEKFLKSSLDAKRKRKESLLLSARTKSSRPSSTTEALSDRDDDADVFYSPGSDSLREDNNEQKVDIYLVQTENRPQMAEEEGEEYNDTVNLTSEEQDTEDVTFTEQTTTQLETEDEEEEDEEMRQVEEIIKQASDELAQVAEENQEIITTMNEEEEAEEEFVTTVVQPMPGDGSAFKFDPAVDSAVLKELEEAERQAKETAKIITELKTRVTELLRKEKCTEAEAKELEEKNGQLKAQMVLFEEKTKRIQFLIAQTNLFDNMVLPKTPLQTKHKEDCLPKVIVCGATTCDNVPKLIMCDVQSPRKSRSPKKKPRNQPCETCYQGETIDEIRGDQSRVSGGVPQIAKRLSDSYFMQEKLVVENQHLEGMRYKLQSDLLSKDQTIELLQRKLCSIQCEMRMLCKENCTLNEKINQVICGQTNELCMMNNQQQPSKGKKTVCGKKRGDCPADLEYRLNEYQQTTKQLEKQLVEMEQDVKVMHNELQSVQAEREHLEQHRNIVIYPPICLPPPACPGPCPPQPCGSPRPCDQSLRELREQYNRLQDDFKSKVTEVGGLRAENEKLKVVAKDAEEARKAMDDKIKECDRMMKAMKNEKNSFLGSKEQLIEQEQQLLVAKQRFREAQDELEELRMFIQEQQGQMDDYRNKYLEAEQKVEEQRRHIDMLEMDATRVNEQVNLEIQRVKGQFQEKLQELMPLPDLLKNTQLKLNEVQQMHLLAERNSEALEKELNIYKEKVAEITSQMDKVRSDQMLGEDDKATLEQRVEQLKQQLQQMQDSNDLLHDELTKAEDLIDEKELELQTKAHEIVQLQAQLESVREESARQVARNKERCETVRRSMQNQISDLERQLVQSRAQAKAAQKDRDEIRQKMQQQINNLHENFEDAQMRIRNLQGHVNFLKVSYPTPLQPGHGDTDSMASDDPCNCP